jgi:hypothetical protein
MAAGALKNLFAYARTPRSPKTPDFQTKTPDFRTKTPDFRPKINNPAGRPTFVPGLRVG